MSAIRVRPMPWCALLEDRSARARFFAAEALGRLAYAPAVPGLVKMLADNNDHDVNLRHAGSLALSRIGDAPSLAALSSHGSRRCGSPPSLRCAGCATPRWRDSWQTPTSRS